MTWIRTSELWYNEQLLSFHFQDLLWEILPIQCYKPFFKTEHYPDHKVLTVSILTQTNDTLNVKEDNGWDTGKPEYWQKFDPLNGLSVERLWTNFQQKGQGLSWQIDAVSITSQWGASCRGNLSVVPAHRLADISGICWESLSKTMKVQSGQSFSERDNNNYNYREEV